jgi:hypothetical protein
MDEFSERLTAVFDRGLRDGLESLSADDQELFRIQYFILSYEMSGLGGHFFNHLPDSGEFGATVQSMRNQRLGELASLLEHACNLFSNYTDPAPPATWKEVLREHDPDGRLDDLGDRITALDNYGIPR